MAQDVSITNSNISQNVSFGRFGRVDSSDIGCDTKIGTFVEIQKRTRIGKNCKISSHVCISEGVRIKDNVVIGHGAILTNDPLPRVTPPDGTLKTEPAWRVPPILVENGAHIGAGAVILANVTIGENAIVCAGSVVTADVPPNGIVAGNPARIVGFVGTEIAVNG